MSKELFNNLENIWKRDEDGVEYVNARDLQHILGYENWRDFNNVIQRAMISCKGNNHIVEDHFEDIHKMVIIGSNAQREVNDVKLTRYACYLSAQNSDPRKKEVAYAQNYFATQTRKFELVEQRMADFERVLERGELKEEERIFSKKYMKEE